MNQVRLLTILYDLMRVIGGQVSLQPMLTRVLMRLLFHTGFPAGVVLREVRNNMTLVLRLEMMVGSHRLTSQRGEAVDLPVQWLDGGIAMLRGKDALGEAATLFEGYATALRLPIRDFGAIVLLGPETLELDLPIGEVFPPVLDNLARAIILCENNDAYAKRLEEDRDSAREKLETERARLHTLVSTIPDIVWLKDLNGVYLYCNPKFELLYGNKAADIIGKTDYDFVSRELADFFRDNDRKALAHGGPRKNEEWLTFAADDYRGLFETTKTPMYDIRGELIGVLGVARDITVRKALEDELRQSNLRFRNLFELSPDPVWTLEGHRFMDCNQAAVEILGYPSKTKLLNLHPSELSPEFQPDGEASFSKAERMMNLAQENGLNRFEWVHTRADGSTFFAEVTLSSITLQDQPVIYCVWRDISERKRAERNLNMAVDVGQVVLWELDLTHDRLIFDHDRLRAVGIEFIDSVSTLQSFLQFVHPDDIDGFVARFKNALGPGSPLFDFEYRLIDNDGQPLWVHTKGSVIQRNTAGQPILAVGTTTNISIRKAVDSELEQHRRHLEELVQTRTSELKLSQQRLESLIENLPAIFFAKDAHGRYLLVNRRYEEGVGINREQVIGYKDQDIFPADVAAAISEIDQRVLSGKEPFTFEEQVPHPDGGYHDYLTTKVPLADDEGCCHTLIGIATDISSLKVLQQDLRLAKEAAETASHAKTAFLANMSHEIRTPINAIMGLAHLVGVESVSAKQQKQLSKIDSAAQHLLDIINDILDFSNIEAGKLALESSNFELGRVMSDVIMRIDKAAHDKGLEVSVDISEPPALLHGDGMRLGRILLNFGENAVKFTQQGHISFVSRAIQQQGDKLWVRIEVSDTGVGIAPENQARLFQPFEQADAAINRQYGGAGLGLPISKRLAELMGGRIGVHSEPGRGSTFWVELPFSLANPPTGNTHPVTATLNNSELTARLARHAGEHILLAEESPLKQDFAWAQRQRLEAIPGLDLKQALKIAKGDPARLAKFLSRFREDHADDPRQIALLITQGEGAQAKRMAHSLKGLFGTFGLSALHVLATDLDAAIRDSDPSSDAILAEMQAELGKVLRALEGLLPTPTPAAAPLDRLDWDMLRTRLAALHEKLEGYEASWARDFEAIRPDLEAIAGEAAQTLARQAESFEFEQALDTLEHILASEPRLRTGNDHAH